MAKSTASICVRAMRRQAAARLAVTLESPTKPTMSISPRNGRASRWEVSPSGVAPRNAVVQPW